MRRASLGLIALGAFLVVLAPMVRWYAYPRIAVAPAAQRSTTTLVGPDATIFDLSTLKEITTDLTTTVRTLGDTEASAAAGGDTVVWMNSTTTRSSDGVIRSQEVERLAFDARTGEAVNCCGEYISDQPDVNTAVKHEGLVVKFPFATEKKTYDFWDGTLRAAVPIDYAGTTSVDGVSVYRFQQTIPRTQVGTTEVPASLLGLEGSGSVQAAEMYSNVRTLWVEPNTGVIIKRAESQDNTLDYGGQPRITTTRVTTGYDDATVKKFADEYGSQGRLLHLVRSVIPQVLFVLGLILMAGGAVLGRRPMRHSPDKDRSLVGSAG